MKSKLLFILLLSTYGGLSVNAQITFQKTFGGSTPEAGQSVQQTTDGGYIIAGNTYSFGAGMNDVYLIKTNASGDTLWTKILGGASDDQAQLVEQTTDGGYIIVGYTHSFGAGNDDVYLLKTDGSGNVIWVRTYGGTDVDRGYSVKQTIDGGYIVAATTRSFGAGYEDIYLIKTNGSGDPLWTKTYGGTGADYGYSIDLTADSGYIISGTYGYSGSNTDAYLIKTNASGDTSWTKTYGGVYGEVAFYVQQTSDGGYILTGQSSFSIASDVYLIKTNGVGDTLWTKTYGGTSYDRGVSVQQTTDGGYIFVGFGTVCSSCPMDVYLIRTNSVGDTLWTKFYGGTDEDLGISVKQTTDGGYIIGAWTQSFGAGAYDFYLIKTDANGNSGCNQSATATIVNAPPTQVSIPAATISSGGTVTAPSTIVGSGGIINTPCTNVGVDEIAGSNSMFIYPNPFSDELLIKRTNPNGTLIIFDITGKEVMRHKTFYSETKINTEKLVSGFYLLNYTDGNNTSNIKIVKF